MEAEVSAVVLGGMIATREVADVVYVPAAAMFGRAHIMTIPGLGFKSVPEAAAEFNAQLDHRYPGRQIAVLAHSQGGLVAVRAARDNPNIVQIAAAATPFGGTQTAMIGWPFVRSTQDMLPGSKFLQELHQLDLPALVRSNRLATISWNGDRVVPWPASRVDGARNYFCGSQSQYAHALVGYPDTLHVPAHGALRPRNMLEFASHMAGIFEHIHGLTLLEPELEALLGTFWAHAVSAASTPLAA